MMFIFIKFEITEWVRDGNDTAAACVTIDGEKSLRYPYDLRRCEVTNEKFAVQLRQSAIMRAQFRLENRSNPFPYLDTHAAYFILTMCTDRLFSAVENSA